LKKNNLAINGGDPVRNDYFPGQMSYDYKEIIDDKFPCKKKIL